MVRNLVDYHVDIDYRFLCDKLSLSEADRVKEYVYEKAKPLVADDNLLGYRLFLNNLNYSIYYYILFFYDYNVSSCCCDNVFLLHGEVNRSNFFELIDRIVDSYSRELATLSLVIYNPLAKNLLNFIRQHIDRDITLDYLAEEFQESKSYINRVFRSATGETVHQYVAKYRIHLAKQLLLQTNDTIDAIGHSCGYNSTSYFSVAFSKATGLPPGKYRKQYHDRDKSSPSSHSETLY